MTTPHWSCHTTRAQRAAVFAQLAEMNELLHLRQVLEEEYKERMRQYSLARNMRLAQLHTIRRNIERAFEHHMISLEFYCEACNLRMEIVKKYPLVKHPKFKQLFLIGEKEVSTTFANWKHLLDRHTQSAVYVKFDPDRFFAEHPPPRGMSYEKAKDLVLENATRAKVMYHEGLEKIDMMRDKFANVIPPPVRSPTYEDLDPIVKQMVGLVLN